jgi:dolichol-phosphate mannosyltransferase
LKPTISVIIPALDEEGNIEATVDEVLDAIGGRFSDCEILIFDDGSSDRTGAITDELAAKDKRVKVTHNKRTMGLGYNYKKGVELAKHDYVILVPGDNQITRDSMIRMFDLINKADIVIPYIDNYWIRPLSRQGISRLFTKIMNLLFWLDLSYYNGPVIHRREIIQKLAPIVSNGFVYQAEILTRLIKSGHSFVEVGMQIRERGSGASKAFSLNNIMSVVRAIAGLMWEIYLGGGDKYCKKVVKIEAIDR